MLEVGEVQGVKGGEGYTVSWVGEGKYRVLGVRRDREREEESEEEEERGR